MPLPVVAVLAFLIAVVGLSAGRVHRTLLLPLQAQLLRPNPQPTITPQAAAFTPEVQRWWPAIERWSTQYQVPPQLVATVMQIESCGHPRARSAAGAIGLFQVMPYHFSSDDDPYQPETNAARGLAYLAGSLRLAEGDAGLALAGYNGGHAVVNQPQSQWPDETRRYVRWGLGLLADLDAGRIPSPVLNSWLAAGGAGLCDQAAGQQIAAVLTSPPISD